MLGQAVRRFATSAVRSSHYAEGPGKNLPFSAPDPEEVKPLPVSHGHCGSLPRMAVFISSDVVPLILCFKRSSAVAGLKAFQMGIVSPLHALSLRCRISVNNPFQFN
ncbi:hypothetical protein MHYP_G00256360 [Metynnis hypsauchen]